MGCINTIDVLYYLFEGRRLEVCELLWKLMIEMCKYRSRKWQFRYVG